jgi:hypothetical protein
VAVALLVMLSFGLYAAHLAWQEELNLHATLYVIRHVNHFVQERARWPESWEELEALPSSEARGFEWAELRERVAIDFRIDVADVLTQEVSEFKPIRPNGHAFAYWKYGRIEDLQESLRKTIPE